MDVNRAGETLLFDYAAGSLPGPVALAVATHLSLRPELRASYEALNAVGGALLTSLEAEPLTEDALDAVLDRLDEPPPPTMRSPELDERTRAVIPPPLRPYLPQSFDALDWRTVIDGVSEYRFESGVPGYKTALLRIAPGRAMPRHSHRGREYTVVLDGAYDDDGDVRLERGDLCEADPADHHRPMADSKTGCTCLIVLDAPLRLTGLTGLLINPFLR